MSQLEVKIERDDIFIDGKKWEIPKWIKGKIIKGLLSSIKFEEMLKDKSLFEYEVCSYQLENNCHSNVFSGDEFVNRDSLRSLNYTPVLIDDIFEYNSLDSFKKYIYLRMKESKVARAQILRSTKKDPNLFFALHSFYLIRHEKKIIVFEKEGSRKYPFRLINLETVWNNYRLSESFSELKTKIVIQILE